MALTSIRVDASVLQVRPRNAKSAIHRIVEKSVGFILKYLIRWRTLWNSSYDARHRVFYFFLFYYLFIFLFFYFLLYAFLHHRRRTLKRADFFQFPVTIVTVMSGWTCTWAERVFETDPPSNRIQQQQLCQTLVKSCCWPRILPSSYLWMNKELEATTLSANFQSTDPGFLVYRQELPGV